MVWDVGKSAVRDSGGEHVENIAYRMSAYWHMRILVPSRSLQGGGGGQQFVSYIGLIQGSIWKKARHFSTGTKMVQSFCQRHIRSCFPAARTYALQQLSHCWLVISHENSEIQ